MNEELCGAQLKDPATGRLGTCIKPKGHHNVTGSRTGWVDRLHEGDFSQARCCEHAGMYHGSTGCDECGCTTARSDMAKVSETATAASRGLGKMAAAITPEVIRALALIRSNLHGMSTTVTDAVNILDNAGIFAAIDEATGYDVDSNCTCPAIERERSGTDNHYIECPQAPVSKCTCLAGPTGRDNHHANCPGDPAEYGDNAYRNATCSCHKDSWAPAGSHRGSCQSGTAK